MIVGTTDLPARPLPLVAPLHDRRHDERPAVSAERPERNRRFVPVPCNGGDAAAVRAYLDEHREQLWAEAVHRVREKREIAYLPDDLKPAQAELTEHYRAVDEVAEDVIGEWVTGNPRPVSIAEIASGISWTPDSRSVYRITTVLKQLGYTRSRNRSDSGRKWLWIPPAEIAHAKLDL